MLTDPSASPDPLISLMQSLDIMTPSELYFPSMHNALFWDVSSVSLLLFPCEAFEWSDDDDDDSSLELQQLQQPPILMNWFNVYFVEWMDGWIVVGCNV
mmetsp:Transcript_13462/g.17630  ORF Transcript_13462/g.17630 Transcript_13462/m.17630 type:complete len:99 (-) Transcript_13462:92-388(-)